MTRERFREVLKEYNISSLTSVIPENITEEELRKLAQIVEVGKMIRGVKDG